MKHKRILSIPAVITLITACFVFTTASNARENVKTSSGKTTPKSPSILAVCGNPTAQTDLEINNVRCKLQTAGDMWWDFTLGAAGSGADAARYEIPKNSGLHSIYAGALWVGGYDQAGQLRVAGQEYGHANGKNDFWPGPLDTTDASIEDIDCNKYDKHFSISRKEVEDFVNGLAPATSAINNWPGNGDVSKGQAQYLAPFVDKNADGLYNPSDGDYPKFDLEGTECDPVNCIPKDVLYGDQLLWWVFNDKGDIHANTTGKPIGLEIRTQAFGFVTDDEINNMTFYNYRIINRSTYQLDTCYFGIWCDADLGNPQDDYAGCDVSRGLGYTYNADNDDESTDGYGANPPAVGIDFFRGPITNPTGVPGDGIDNNRDCQVDELCEQAIMSKFVYYTNGGGSSQADPINAVEYYNYLSGKWQDGTRWTYGGTGYLSGGTPADFMYPGSSDQQYAWGTGGNCQAKGVIQAPWEETVTCTNKCDRRMMQSAGPFTLLPGAVNVITTGVVWAQASSGGAKASVSLLLSADDKAQALFDNCFKVLNGPDAPDLTIQELDKKLILYISNKPSSNNAAENYSEFDPFITLFDSLGNKLPCADTTYNFEGYKIYQLKNAFATNLEDPDEAQLVAQCDLKNGVDRIINYEFDASLGGSVPKEKVVGADQGVFHSLVVTKDLFAKGDPTLINHKTYYFMATAYGYNNYKPYKQDIVPALSDNVCPLPDSPPPAMDGQKKPYKQGRKNILAYSAIPHNPAPGSGGTEMHSDYGDALALKVTRIEGNGNGGNVLDFTAATVNSILSSGVYSLSSPTNALYSTPEYELGKGPLPVFKVIDPLNVNMPASTTFTLWFIPDTASSSATVNLGNSKWKLKNNSTGDTISSDQTIKFGYEQLIIEWGVSFNIEQITQPGSASSTNNGFLEASMSSNSWLTAFADKDTAYYSNWIRSGADAVTSDGFSGDFNLALPDSVGPVDEGEYYEGVLGGTWAPYRLCANSASTPLTSAKYYGGPGWKSTYTNTTRMSDLASVDVVFTNDNSKWSRCVVLETCDDSVFTEHLKTSGANNNRGGLKLGKRRGYSVDKNGNTSASGTPISTNPNDPNYIDSIGMGWFPGYAINLETGERLNICFGENSALTSSVGAISYNSLVGTFQVAPIKETVTGGTSGATGVMVTDNGFTIRIKNIAGTFSVGETITGSISGATAIISKYTTFEQNGRDMKWNPTANVYGENPWDSTGAGPVLGGMHFIYVFGHNRDSSSDLTFNINIPRYDEGRLIDSLLSSGSPYGFPLDVASKRKVFRDAMWVNIPLLSTGNTLLSSDATVRLRVAKPYKIGYSPSYSAGIPAAGDTVYSDISLAQQNNNYPKYTFSTADLETHTGDAEVLKDALDLINIVPNPYYAYSSYETSGLDNRVKITNLPEKCTVSIYNLSGALIRKYKKAEAFTNHTPKGFADPDNAWHDGSLDWDLKNTAGIPISSGVYIIHIEVPGAGEKILKWFGVMRPIDLDSF